MYSMSCMCNVMYTYVCTTDPPQHGLHFSSSTRMTGTTGTNQPLDSDSAWVRPSVAIPPAVFLGFGFVASINLSNVNVPMTNTAPSNGCVRNFDASYCSFTIDTESKIGLPRSASRPIISKILSNKNRSWSIYISTISIYLYTCMYVCMYVQLHTYIQVHTGVHT